MRIFIVSQDDNLYLPNAMATVCERFGKQVACIVAAPGLSGKGGPLRNLLRHSAVFGPRGTMQMALRVARAKLSAATSRGTGRPFHSLKQMAESFDIPFAYVHRLKSPEFQSLIEQHPADLLVSMSCPQIIGRKIRRQFPQGCINVHGSPLPRYRGMMPAFWVLRNGESATASTVHDLAAKLDDGDILVQREVSIAPDETWNSLVRKTKAAGASALVEAIEKIQDGSLERRPNREADATYFSFPTRADGKAFRAAGRRFFEVAPQGSSPAARRRLNVWSSIFLMYRYFSRM